jgi:hypothetical protein
VATYRTLNPERDPAMIYRMLADGLLVVHGAYLAFLVVGGFLAWRWRWVMWAHLIAVAWAVPLVVTDAFPCPLTEWEKWLQEKGGEEPYSGGPRATPGWWRSWRSA